MKTYKEITHCRICGNDNLEIVIQLGNQQLTGVFPTCKDEKISAGPLTLVKCSRGKNINCCGLLQLRHSFSDNEMYCQTYGYRSGLNRSMVKHLNGISDEIINRIKPCTDDVVLDIGSNDSTFLNFFLPTGARLIGIDPGGAKFSKYYSGKTFLINGFFSSAKVKEVIAEKKVKVITSIAMFYDLEDPFGFMKEVAEILDENGIWVFEQSYLPDMLKTNSYDTICHEHKEYYALSQINWMTERLGLSIIDVSRNITNGGSFRVTVSKKTSRFPANSALVENMLLEEKNFGLNEMEVYRKFGNKISRLKEELTGLIHTLNKEGKKIFGYGASTKGNVMLQYCGFSSGDIPFIADVNEDKWGSFTPGTHIPIIPEQEAKQLRPDYYVVLPWHFRDFILEKEKEFRGAGGKFIFPFPEVEVV